MMLVPPLLELKVKGWHSAAVQRALGLEGKQICDNVKYVVDDRFFRVESGS